MCLLLVNGIDAQLSAAMTGAEFEALFARLSNWSRWGATDELGTLNFISPDVRRAAAQEVREGLSLSLTRTVESTQEAADGSHARLRMLGSGATPNITAHTDELTIAPHGAAFTHFDAPSHFFFEGRLYNGVPRFSVTERGAGRLSVLADIGGVFTRGVLLDLPRCKGVERLPSGSPILQSELNDCAKTEGVALRVGDAVLLRTGRAEGSQDTRAGVQYSAVEWFKTHDVAAVGTDSSIDQWPSGVEGIRSPVHVLLLVAMGTPILDNLALDELAEVTSRRHRWTFLFSVAPLAVSGATGSPVNPLAVF